MRIALRRMRFAFAVVIVLIALAVGFALLHRDEPSVVLKGNAILRDNYVLGTCRLVTGEYCIWSFDFDSKQFAVHVRSDAALRVLEGSTKERVTWTEVKYSPDQRNYLLRGVFTRALHDAEPTQLIFSQIAGAQTSKPIYPLAVQQAYNNADTLFITLRAAQKGSPEPVVCIDIPTQKEIGRLPNYGYTFGNLWYAGLNKEFIALIEYSGIKRQLALLDAKDLHVVSQGLHSGSKLGFGLCVPTGPMSFLLPCGNFSYTEYEIVKSDSGIKFQEGSVFTYEESAISRSVLTAMQNSIRSVRQGGAWPPKWDTRYLNVPVVRYGQDLFVWESINPPAIHAAKPDQENPFAEIRLEQPGALEWPFVMNEVRTKLITRNQVDRFQLWEISTGKMAILGEWRIAYNKDTTSLNIVQFNSTD